MRGPARIATYLGRSLIAAGFLLIVLAWNGAASLDYIQGQFPFLLSGGVPGLALIVVGAGLEYIQAQREITAKRAKQMATVNASLLRLVTVIRDGHAQVLPPAPAPEPVAVGAVAAGARAGGPGAPASSAPGDGNYVVAGRSSFHAAHCHLVAGRDDMAVITQLEAVGQGLSPCKICKP